MKTLKCNTNIKNKLIVLALIIMTLITGCSTANDTKRNVTEIEVVTQAIESIGEVTREDAAIIEETYLKYNELSEEMQAEVENYEKLLSAQEIIQDIYEDDAFETASRFRSSLKYSFDTYNFMNIMKEIEAENLFAQKFNKIYSSVKFDEQSDLSLALTYFIIFPLNRAFVELI